MSRLRTTLAGANDLLLSHNSTQTEYDAALEALERVLASLALDSDAPAPTPDLPTLLDAFLALQDGFELNITATLLEWLGRLVGELKRGQSAEEQETTRGNLARGLGLVQGLLLLHRRSQRLFARRSTLENMLTVLQHSRSSLPASPSCPTVATTPSPVLLPPSPAPSSSSRGNSPSRAPTVSTQTALALITLDTLLCAVVDRPRNMRAFESVGGLAAIVKVLKDRTVAQPVRIKAIEILYFYLLPERPSTSRRATSTSSSDSSCYSDVSSSDPFLSATPPPRSPLLPSLLASAASDFVPQTPHKSRHTRQRSSVSSTSSAEPSKSPRKRSLEGDGTPKASRAAQASAAAERAAPPPFLLVDHSTPRGRGPIPPPAARDAPRLVKQGSVDADGERRPGRTTGATRTTAEKREMLRTVMPNVEALEHRFEAMGLSGWES